MLPLILLPDDDDEEPYCASRPAVKARKKKKYCHAPPAGRVHCCGAAAKEFMARRLRKGFAGRSGWRGGEGRLVSGQHPI